MAKNSKIAWTDHTFNPWWGCVKVSDGCKNCYAERDDKRFTPEGEKTHWGPGSPRRFFGDKHWQGPRKWNDQKWMECLSCGWRGDHKKRLSAYVCPSCGEFTQFTLARQRVFAGSMCDIFEIHPNRAVNYDLNLYRNLLFNLIAATPNLDWLLLTKRPENIKPFAGDQWEGDPIFKLPNIWWGTSVEDQKTANERVPELLNVPARVRWLSVEPMLGPVGLRPRDDFSDRGHGKRWLRSDGINWVIVGGESGPEGVRRPFDLEWGRALRDQCQAAGVPFFFKQVDKVIPIPDDLMIREYPET